MAHKKYTACCAFIFSEIRALVLKLEILLEPSIKKMFMDTGDAKYLYRAARFAEFCFDWGKHGCRIADRPLSLFEGLAGTIYFMTDLLNPQTAKFPAFYL